MRSTSNPHALGELQAAQRSASDVAPIDLTYGFPGRLPTVGRGASNKRLLRFFEEYVRLGNAREAAGAADYSAKWAKDTSYKVLKEHADYVTWLQAHFAQQNMKQLAVSQEDVLREIARIAFANEYDYLVFEKNGAKVGVRRKRLYELTCEQMVAIEITGSGENLTYRLRDKEGRQQDLGRHLGLFNEKVILEHRHRHLRAAMDLSKVRLACQRVPAVRIGGDERCMGAGRAGSIKPARRQRRTSHLSMRAMRSEAQGPPRYPAIEPASPLGKLSYGAALGLQRKSPSTARPRAVGSPSTAPGRTSGAKSHTCRLQEICRLGQECGRET